MLVFSSPPIFSVCHFNISKHPSLPMSLACPMNSNNYPLIATTCLTSRLYSTRLPPLAANQVFCCFFTQAFISSQLRLSTSLLPIMPSAKSPHFETELEPWFHLFKSKLEDQWPVLFCHPSEPWVTQAGERELAILGISTWSCVLCLSLQRPNLCLCLTVVYERNEAPVWYWWNWELTTVKNLLDFLSLLYNLSLSSLRKPSLVTLSLDVLFPFPVPMAREKILTCKHLAEVDILPDIFL